mgnify:CR=1 FL=1
MSDDKDYYEKEERRIVEKCHKKKEYLLKQLQSLAEI